MHPSRFTCSIHNLSSNRIILSLWLSKDLSDMSSTNAKSTGASEGASSSTSEKVCLLSTARNSKENWMRRRKRWTNVFLAWLHVKIRSDQRNSLKNRSFQRQQSPNWKPISSKTRFTSQNRKMTELTSLQEMNLCNFHELILDRLIP